MESYKTILREGQAEFKDRGSRFLAIAFPAQSADEFKTRLATIKKEHPKANHHCFAYRIGTDGNQFRVSDDGEPSGSAGRPILGTLDSRGITNSAIVVVRYFGGTLLGVPGLINAYKTAASLALQVTPSEERIVESEVQVSCNYKDVNEVMRIVKLFDGRIIKEESSLFCMYTFAVARNKLESFIQQMSKLYEVEIKAL